MKTSYALTELSKVTLYFIPRLRLDFYGHGIL